MSKSNKTKHQQAPVLLCSQAGMNALNQLRAERFETTDYESYLSRFSELRRDGVDHINTSYAGTSDIGQFLSINDKQGYYDSFLERKIPSLRAFSLFLRSGLNEPLFLIPHGVPSHVRVSTSVSKNEHVLMAHALWQKISASPLLSELLVSITVPIDWYIWADGGLRKRTVSGAAYGMALNIIRAALTAGLVPDFTPFFDYQTRLKLGEVNNEVEAFERRAACFSLIREMLQPTVEKLKAHDDERKQKHAQKRQQRQVNQVKANLGSLNNVVPVVNVQPAPDVELGEMVNTVQPPPFAGMVTLGNGQTPAKQRHRFDKSHGENEYSLGLQARMLHEHDEKRTIDAEAATNPTGVCGAYSPATVGTFGHIDSLAELTSQPEQGSDVVTSTMSITRGIDDLKPSELQVTMDDNRDGVQAVFTSTTFDDVVMMPVGVVSVSPEQVGMLAIGASASGQDMPDWKSGYAGHVWGNSNVYKDTPDDRLMETGQYFTNPSNQVLADLKTEQFVGAADAVSEPSPVDSDAVVVSDLHGLNPDVELVFGADDEVLPGMPEEGFKPGETATMGAVEGEYTDVRREDGHVVAELGVKCRFNDNNIPTATNVYRDGCMLVVEVDETVRSICSDTTDSPKVVKDSY